MIFIITSRSAFSSQSFLSLFSISSFDSKRSSKPPNGSTLFGFGVLLSPFLFSSIYLPFFSFFFFDCFLILFSLAHSSSDISSLASSFLTFLKEPEWWLLRSSGSMKSCGLKGENYWFCLIDFLFGPWDMSPVLGVSNGLL